MPVDSAPRTDSARSAGESSPEPAWAAIERHTNRILVAGALVATNLVIVEVVASQTTLGLIPSALSIGLTIALFALLHRAVVRMARGALRTARREARTSRDLLGAVEQISSESAGTRGTLEALEGAASASGLEVFTWQPQARALWSVSEGRSYRLGGAQARNFEVAMAERGPMQLAPSSAPTHPIPTCLMPALSSERTVIAPMWSGNDLLGVIMRRQPARRGIRKAEDLALVSGFAAVGAVALGKAAIVDSERERARDNELLLRSVHAATQHRERDQLGQRAAEAAQALDASAAAIFVLQSGRLRLAATCGIDRGAAAGCGTLRISTPLMRHTSNVMGAPVPAVHSVAHVDEPTAVVLSRLGFDGHVATHVLRDAEGDAGLLVVATEFESLSAGQELLLAAFGRQASSAIEHGRMQRSMRKRSRHLACTPKLARCLVGLREPDDVARTAARELHDAFGFTSVAVALKHADAEQPSARMRLIAEFGMTSADKPTLADRLDAVLEECATSGRPFVSIAATDAEAHGQGSRIAVPIAGTDRTVLGVVCVAESDADALGEDDLHMLETIADQLAGTLEQAALIDRLEQSYFKTVEALSAALEAKDAYTLDHARSITDMTASVGRHLGMREEEIRDLRLGALLHDIGKIGVPNEILSKPGPLDDDEYEVMKQHTIIGEQIIAPVEFLQSVRPLVLHEHERWDGRGYPHGLEREKIPLGARLSLSVMRGMR